MKIRTFGDSHSVNGWPYYVVNNHLGPTLAYSFGRDKLNRLDITKYEVNEGDHLVFCFGEIDCRCQVNKRGGDYTQTISSIVYEYVDAVKQNIDKLNKDVNVWLYNVVPPATKGTFAENDEYPIIGTDEERKEYVEYFNKGLRMYANYEGWNFFDVYDNYTNDNGMMKWELSDGNVHIGNGIYIEQFIQQNIK